MAKEPALVATYLSWTSVDSFFNKKQETAWENYLGTITFFPLRLPLGEICDSSLEDTECDS